jgi:hypothetical protein
MNSEFESLRNTIITIYKSIKEYRILLNKEFDESDENAIKILIIINSKNECLFYGENAKAKEIEILLNDLLNKNLKKPNIDW